LGDRLRQNGVRFNTIAAGLSLEIERLARHSASMRIPRHLQPPASRGQKAGASTPEWTRRRFLQCTLAASALPWLTGCGTVIPGQRLKSPNSMLQHASIGVGGMGLVDLRNFSRHGRTRVVALCDVDSGRLDKAAQEVKEARKYADWREMLAREGDRIDTVSISIPDHMHFAAAYAALKAGKNVYCQKPLCHDVAEVRALTRGARHRVTQLGTQMASSAHDRTVVQWLREGRIGQVTRAYFCANRPGAVEAYRLTGPRPVQGEEPPSQLAWDLWLGTAPARPYASDIYHPTKWRAWQDFGTGWSGDIGCHLFDAVWKGLNLRAPTSVRARVQESWKNSPERRADTWPQSNHITWTFPANEAIAGTELTAEWVDGEFLPPEHIRKLYGNDLKQYPAESVMLIGTEGSLLSAPGYPPTLLPEEKFRGVRAPSLKDRNHYHHFLDACLGGEPTESHFGVAGPMTEAILLGTVAVRVPERRLTWDAPRMRFGNAPDANTFLRRNYRQGWRSVNF
jgi:predicted dehydrogenase